MTNAFTSPAIREYMKGREVTAEDVSAHFGVSRSEANTRLLSMMQKELVTARMEGEVRHFALGREPKFTRYKSPADRLAQRAARNRAARAREAMKRQASRIAQETAAALAKRKPVKHTAIRAETYADWLAKGGVPDEILPGCQYVPSTIIPALVSMRGASACP